MQEKQLYREVRWALWLTLIYILGWVLAAYGLPTDRGWLGFPLWFEVSCIYLPIGFIGLIAWVVKAFFQDIALERKE